jgi:hypothetical protein
VLPLNAFQADDLIISACQKLIISAQERATAGQNIMSNSVVSSVCSLLAYAY